MYIDHFGLTRPPFRIVPDPQLFFSGGDRGAVLKALVYSLVNGEGMLKVVGEVGSGKSMLCRMLERVLPKDIEIIYIANPRLTPDDILQAIMLELYLPVQNGVSRLQLLNQLHHYLLRRHAAGKQVVVFIDEAQSMPVETLEEVRLLSNLETAQHKLLQIVLFGQPELDRVLAMREIRQLRERITHSLRLLPLSRWAIAHYLDTRLKTCGYQGQGLFSKMAIRQICSLSNGLFRRTNILADKAMLAAYTEGLRHVKRRHIRAAARDSEFVDSFQWMTLFLPRAR